MARCGAAGRSDRKLSDVAEIPIRIDRSSVRESGIRRRAPVTLELTEQKLRTALFAILPRAECHLDQYVTGPSGSCPRNRWRQLGVEVPLTRSSGNGSPAKGSTATVGGVHS